MSSGTTEIHTVATVAKSAAAINHLKENRLEYLVLLVLSHLLGITSVFVEKAQGVCY